MHDSGLVATSRHCTNRESSTAVMFEHRESSTTLMFECTIVHHETRKSLKLHSNKCMRHERIHSDFFALTPELLRIDSRFPFARCDQNSAACEHHRNFKSRLRQHRKHPKQLVCDAQGRAEDFAARVRELLVRIVIVGRSASITGNPENCAYFLFIISPSVYQ